MNHLGNLTILSKVINSRMQNGTIEEKLPELKKSELEINKRLVNQLEGGGNKWGKSEIEARQQELAMLAFHEIWCL